MKNSANPNGERNTHELFPIEDGHPCRYHVYLATHQGKVRSDNQDNFIVNNVYRSLETPEKKLMGENIEEPLTCAVFDGMGGEANGELASKLCAEAAMKVYQALINGEEDIDATVFRFVEESNRAVVGMLENTMSKRGGSTFVMLIFRNGVAYPYSLGDSRIYLYHGGTLQLITNDQTLAMKKFRANIFTWEEAQVSPDRHKLTSFLGIDVDGEGLEPQAYQPIRMEAGDKLLLCSDGLYDMCTDAQIAKVLEASSGDACLSLVDSALENGGGDNVTCIVVERA